MTLDESIERRLSHRYRVEAAGLGGQAAEMSMCSSGFRGMLHWFHQWAYTYDPRVRQTFLPFDLFPRQEQFLEYLWRKCETQTNGLAEKSRDTGLTNLCAGFAIWKWLFVPGFKTGFGSRKLDLVDKSGDPDSIFEKLRTILFSLPKWMFPKGFKRDRHDCYTKLIHPTSGAVITGEGGDNIGRGGRTTMYFVDEAAFLENANSIERSLSQNTRCRVDVSTPNGPGNYFATLRHSGKVEIFTMHWRDDPRKSEAWYEDQKRRYDPVTIAQEIDIDYSASVEGVVIPAAHVRAAVNLLPRENATGPIIVGFDVADQGPDKCVLMPRQGPHVLDPLDWGATNTTESAWRARDFLVKIGAKEVVFDVGGVGAGPRGTWESSTTELPFLVTPVNFGEKPTENRWPDGRTAHEKFLNRRAEMYFVLRTRFEKAYEFKEKGVQHPPEEMISIPNHPELIAELSLPLMATTETGKIKLQPKKDLAKSPNFADALALAFSGGNKAWIFGTSPVADSPVANMPREVSTTVFDWEEEDYDAH